MRRRLLAVGALLAMAAAAAGAAPADDAAVLTKQLEAFLGSASRGDAAAHDRFWADDLIYTGSGGRRVGKADILRDVRATPAPRPDDPKTTFAAEDVRIHPYGDMAVVAFHLVGTTTRADGSTRVARYLNSGTFRKQNGQWRAVSWQATRLATAELEARDAVAAAGAAFEGALRQPDAKRLASLTDTTFVWTRGSERVSRARLLDKLGSGRPYAGLATDSVTVTVRGDAAVARGVWGKSGFYTLTFYQQDGDWKALSLETARP